MELNLVSSYTRQGLIVNIAVIGAGSWGTAIAQLLATNGHSVRLWAHREMVAEYINEHHRNPDYLVDVDLSDKVTASSSYESVISGTDAVCIVTPSVHLRETANAIAPYITDEMRIVICSKGIEKDTGLIPVELFAEVVGKPERLAALSGPNHAEEVVKGIPAATVVASVSQETAAYFQELFASKTFRVYTGGDVKGVEICAAFKNVIAIAVGLSYGIGYGDNTAAMLMTRGQAEMGRLVVAAGGDALTCMGLAGTGDLIATCMSQHSRNRTFGEALAKGETLEAYEARRHMVVEGAQACKTLGVLARRYNVELPIANVVKMVVWEGRSPRDAIEALSNRSLKSEMYGITRTPHE